MNPFAGTLRRRRLTHWRGGHWGQRKVGSSSRRNAGSACGMPGQTKRRHGKPPDADGCLYCLGNRWCHKKLGRSQIFSLLSPLAVLCRWRCCRAGLLLEPCGGRERGLLSPQKIPGGNKTSSVDARMWHWGWFGGQPFSCCRGLEVVSTLLLVAWGLEWAQ